MAISTADSAKAGSHFDIIYIDDLVNETNYKNATALETGYQNYVNILPLLEPTGYLLVTGTRYSFDDAYQRIQENAQKSLVWRFSIKSCWVKNADGSVGTLFPPAVTRTGRAIGQSLEFLAAQKAEMGDASFANQYENNPIASSAIVFTEEMIAAQTITDPRLLPSAGDGRVFIFLVGDLAYSESDARDISVVYTVMKFQGSLYVIDANFGHWTSNQLIETTIHLLKTKRPNIVYYERPSGPADALLNLIVARAKSIGLQKVPIEFVKTSNVKGAKATRIGNIQAVLLSRRLWLYGGMPGYNELVSQLTKFPRTRKDDFADCLARACELPSNWQFDDPPPSMDLTPNWLQRLNKSAPVEEQDSRPAGSYGPENWK